MRHLVTMTLVLLALTVLWHITAARAPMPVVAAQVNRVQVTADRVVHSDGEFELSGNVRMRVLGANAR